MQRKTMGGENMLQNLKSRTFAWMAGTAVAVVAVGAMFVGAASAQNKEPIKIGFGMSLTGPLAANGKQALLGMPNEIETPAVTAA